MNQKFLIILAAIIFLAVGTFLFFTKQQEMTSVQNQGIETSDNEILKQPQDYSQHIEEILGNTDEVWYNIPELGVRMKLNKEFAEELIYIFTHEKNTLHNEEWDAAYFSTKSLTAIDNGCSPKEGHPLGVITKNKGNVRELAKIDVFYSSRINEIIQIEEYYYMLTGPQATCWNPKNEEEIQKARSSKDYIGSGPKYISDGMKTLQTFPSLDQPIDTSNWKTYRNEEYGFEFKLPTGWSIEKTNIKSLFYLKSQNFTPVLTGYTYRDQPNLTKGEISVWIIENTKNLPVKSVYLRFDDASRLYFAHEEVANRDTTQSNYDPKIKSQSITRNGYELYEFTTHQAYGLKTGGFTTTKILKIKNKILHFDYISQEEPDLQIEHILEEVVHSVSDV